MPNKSELEKEVNDRLDMDIEWSQLKKEDLETFRDKLSDEGFIKSTVAQYANQATGNEVETKIKNWSPGQFAAIAMSDEASLKDLLF